MIASFLWMAFVYALPAFRTFQAFRGTLASCSSTGEEDGGAPRHSEALVRALRYWICVGVLCPLVALLDFFASWVPFYVEAKMLAALWIGFGSGADILWMRGIYPMLVEYEDDITVKISQVQTASANGLTRLGGAGFSSLQTQAIFLITGLASTIAKQQHRLGEARVAAASPPRRSCVVEVEKSPNATVPCYQEKGYEEEANLCTPLRFASDFEEEDDDGDNGLDDDYIPRTVKGFGAQAAASAVVQLSPRCQRKGSLRKPRKSTESATIARRRLKPDVATSQTVEIASENRQPTAKFKTQPGFKKHPPRTAVSRRVALSELNRLPPN